MRTQMEEKVLVYENPLCSEHDLEGFVLEGNADIRFQDGTMIMKNKLANELGQKANYVLWCPEHFPADVQIEWDFRPMTNEGLCMLFFAAAGIHGEDLFDESLQKRTGEYNQYHSGDINAYHVSYFRRKEPDERAFHTCNLRKSKGFYLVAQGADPIPDAADAMDFYHICVRKKNGQISFSVNDLCVFTFMDDNETYGSLLGEGKIGFRQMAPLTAAYRNLKVFQI